MMKPCHEKRGRGARAPLRVSIGRVLSLLERNNRRFVVPIVTQVAGAGRDPFRVLISCLLSLRTKDRTTAEATSRLFALAGTPCALAALAPDVVEKAIFPVGFYRTKARTVVRISREILDRFDGAVPDDIDTLLTLKGVGRKTANLVVTAAFGKPGICVDTHVHRISNRLGMVRTRTPHETEQALRARLPRRHWIPYNDILVTHGQNVCKPLSPLCSECPIRGSCPRIGVGRSR